MFDLNEFTKHQLEHIITEISSYQIPYFLVANKIDLANEAHLADFQGFENIVFISAHQRADIKALEDKLVAYIQAQPLSEEQVVITNLRHYESLQNALQSLRQVQASMELGLSTEMLASDMREAIYHLGAIVGEVSNNDLLDFIFSKFCIGK